MKTKLSNYIKRKRLEHGLNTAQLSEKMGYRNINKGMRRISALEREGFATVALPKKVADTLKLDVGYIDSLIRKDREVYEAEYERWVNEPVKMKYTVRLMPAVYLSYDLPSDIKTEDEAINYATIIAKEKSNLVWLELDRRTTIFINELGEVTGRHATRACQSNSSTYLRIK